MYTYIHKCSSQAAQHHSIKGNRKKLIQFAAFEPKLVNLLTIVTGISTAVLEGCMLIKIFDNLLLPV